LQASSFGILSANFVISGKKLPLVVTLQPNEKSFKVRQNIELHPKEMDPAYFREDIDNRAANLFIHQGGDRLKGDMLD
jgi:hypothetical protein